MAVAGVQSASMFNHSQNDGIKQRSRASSIVQMWRELEDEYMSSPGRERPHDILSRMSSYETNYSTTSSEEREWQQSEETSSRNRREWLGEMEQERVRVIREWVHSTSQRREPSDRIEQLLDGLVGSRKGIQRLWGRQALLDMLKKTERERRFEIAKLLERRAVSQFPHRLRIQAVLRARFLRKSDDGIGGDMGLPRRSSASDHIWIFSTSSDFTVEMRKDNLRTVSIVSTASETSFVESVTKIALSNAAIASNMELDGGCRSTEGEGIPWENSQETQMQWRALRQAENDASESENGENVPAISCRDSVHLESITRKDSFDLGGNVSIDKHEGQYSNIHFDTLTDTSSEKGDHVSENSCQDSSQFLQNIGPVVSFEHRQSVSEDSQNIENEEDASESLYRSGQFFLSNRPIPSDIQELLSRRSVSALLRSSFCRNLNELLQVHFQRQSSATPEEHEPGTSAGPEEYANAWDAIGELRMDMERLCQRMNGMQRMVEACMKMQLKLQESGGREIPSAGRWTESDRNFDYVRRGVCCVCHSSSIDSLLYRCGHKCTCLNCANRLISSAGKCPMCWASVAQVF